MPKSITYIENDAPLEFAAGLVLSDREGATLYGAIVYFRSGFAAGEDVLGLTSAYGITGSYDAGTGQLTLAGAATLAQYQEVLRSVTYSNTSDDPSGKSRSLAILVDDGAPGGTLHSVMQTRIRLDPVRPTRTLGACSGASHGHC